MHNHCGARTAYLYELLQDGINIFPPDFKVYGGKKQTEQLCTAILDEYLHDEIGMLPVGKWLQRFQNWLLLNKPYFDAKYKAAAMEFDPLITDLQVRDKGNKAKSENAHAYRSGSVNERSESDREHGTGDVHTDTSGNETGTSLQDGAGTSHEDKTQDTVSDGTKAVTGNGEKHVTGNSNRDTTEHEETSKTTITRFADTPQSEIASGSTVIPTWLTNYTHVNETGQADKTGNEKIQSSEDTTTKDQQDTTTHDTANQKTVTDGTTTNVVGTDHTIDNTGTLDTKTEDFSTANRDSKAATSVGIDELWKKLDKADEREKVKGRRGQNPSALMAAYYAQIQNVTREYVEAMGVQFIGVAQL